MDIKFADSFGKSLRKIRLTKNIFYKYFWTGLWYDIKFGVKNFYRYRKIVWNARDWDYRYILEMMQFQLKDLCHGIETKYANEAPEGRLPKVAKMKETLELLKNILDDNYAERCGYVSPDNVWFEPCGPEHPGCSEMKTDAKQSDEELRKIFKDARDLEKEEFEKFCDNLKDLKYWWD